MQITRRISNRKSKDDALPVGALREQAPALMVTFVRGRIPREEQNPVNRLGEALYEPCFWCCLRNPFATLLLMLGLGASALYPATRLGSEFMPKLDEGDLLYMPTAPASVSIGKAREVLQQTDKLIATVPEVRSVHGKIGRADTATDPAPLSMIETVVQLEPDHDKWRQRPVARWYDGWPASLRTLAASVWPKTRAITTEELKYGWTDPDGTRHRGLDEIVRLPGVANAWPYPIENRLNMLATGIKTPVGIKLYGPELAELDRLARATAAVRPHCCSGEEAVVVTTRSGTNGMNLAGGAAVGVPLISARSSPPSTSSTRSPMRTARGDSDCGCRRAAGRRCGARSEESLHSAPRRHDPAGASAISASVQLRSRGGSGREVPSLALAAASVALTRA